MGFFADDDDFMEDYPHLKPFLLAISVSTVLTIFLIFALMRYFFPKARSVRDWNPTGSDDERRGASWEWRSAASQVTQEQFYALSRRVEALERDVRAAAVEGPADEGSSFTREISSRISGSPRYTRYENSGERVVYSGRNSPSRTF
jgi:hypothetical protein